MPNDVTKQIAEFYAPNRQAWRKWLEKNHAKEKNVWLILQNQGSKIPSIRYDEAVEEALCFGWIDSRPRKRDAESHFLLFAKRNPKSKWSKLNRDRVAKMMKQRRMTRAGLAVVELAKKSGAWTALDGAQNAVVPADLEKAFGKNKTAFKYFEAFPPSSKRIILEWILSAKQAETRKKRIQETVTLAAKNIRANHWRQ